MDTLRTTKGAEGVSSFVAAIEGINEAVRSKPERLLRAFEIQYAEIVGRKGAERQSAEIGVIVCRYVKDIDYQIFVVNRELNKLESIRQAFSENTRALRDIYLPLLLFTSTLLLSLASLSIYSQLCAEKAQRKEH